MTSKKYLSIAFLVGIVAMAVPSWSATTLEWWQFWTDPDIKPTILEMVKEFEAKNPDVKINVTDLTWAQGRKSW